MTHRLSVDQGRMNASSSAAVTPSSDPCRRTTSMSLTPRLGGADRALPYDPISSMVTLIVLSAITPSVTIPPSCAASFADSRRSLWAGSGSL